MNKYDYIYCLAVSSFSCVEATNVQPLQFRHLENFGGPVFNVTVWGDELEDFDQAIAFEMHDCAAGG